MTDAEKPVAIDIKKALRDPGSVFTSPEDLLRHDAYSKEQKIEILRRWDYDASELSVAVEEGMPGGNDNLLQRIRRALHQVSGGVDMERTGPTKQHGIPRSAIKPK